MISNADFGDFGGSTLSAGFVHKKVGVFAGEGTEKA
jgi:hypothetical protein